LPAHSERVFAFDFDRRFGKLVAVFGAMPDRCWVRVGQGWLSVRFGFFSLDTPLSNVRDATVTGPYAAARVLGVRTSLTDRGLTFGSGTRRGTCILFDTPVRARPFDITEHPGLTVTVTDPKGLAAALAGNRQA
jgi:hypothetical protein